MSGASSSVVAWSSLLEPVTRPVEASPRPDDPRLGEVVELWTGAAAALTPGRAVLVGFPQDEGVRRNRGRVGASLAPERIRHHLYRLVPWDGSNDVELTEPVLLDIGNIRCDANLEASQQALGEVVGGLLQAGTVPIILGGGHETAYGHYLGYVRAGIEVGIVNVDAHLDVRPLVEGKGHSGSPFRQCLEHTERPLPGLRYVCLGAQPGAVSRAHWLYARERGSVVRFADDLRTSLEDQFIHELARLDQFGCRVMVTLDADAVHLNEVPATSAPNAAGFAGRDVLGVARRAGQARAVASLDLVEIAPPLDEGDKSSRWGALVVWNFLAGLAVRSLA
ncbi:MAG: formimidoylglutamase [Gemmataceae bacterium]